MEEWLVSEETGLPFSHCVGCRLPLLEIDAPWLVNKDYHRGECVLEYAVCQPCRDSVSARLSEESKAAVRGFLEREIDWEARLAEFMAMHGSGSPFFHLHRLPECRAGRWRDSGFPRCLIRAGIW